MTAAPELEPGRPAGSAIPDRPGLQVASVASGLLLLLDAHRLTGRLPPRDPGPGEPAPPRGQARHPSPGRQPAEAGAGARPGGGPGAALRAWIADQPWAQPGPQGWVYLLCFRDPATGEHRPLQGQGCRGQYAGHYWGWTQDLVRRISQHRNPTWTGAGRLVQVALAAGLSFELAWLEYPATRGRERRLKNQGSAYRRCPLCRGTGGPLDPAPAVAAVHQQLGGRP